LPPIFSLQALQPAATAHLFEEEDSLRTEYAMLLRALQ
jgi:hypothetical protein